MNTVFFQLTAGTDVGLSRSNNEDNFVVSPNLAKSEWFIPNDEIDFVALDKKGCLLVIADGMGGMNAGEVASRIAIETVQDLFLADKLEHIITDDAGQIEAYMKNAVLAADMAIKEHALENKEAAGMGTTLVVAWILDDKAYVAWCGDSRAYAYHPVSGLKQLSRDHSYVQELIDSGKLDEECAFDHPHNNIITRSLGDPRKAAEPDYVVYDLHNDETILLCTDGLSGMLRDREIEKNMSETSTNVYECKSRLIEAALEKGGHDNITVALCKILSGTKTLNEKKVSQIATTNIIKVKRNRLMKLLLLIPILLLIFLALGYYYMQNMSAKYIDTSQEIKYKLEEPILVVEDESDDGTLNTQTPAEDVEESPDETSEDETE